MTNQTDNFGVWIEQTGYYYQYESQLSQNLAYYWKSWNYSLQYKVLRTKDMILFCQNGKNNLIQSC